MDSKGHEDTTLTHQYKIPGLTRMPQGMERKKQLFYCETVSSFPPNLTNKMSFIVPQYHDYVSGLIGILRKTAFGLKTELLT